MPMVMVMVMPKCEVKHIAIGILNNHQDEDPFFNLQDDDGMIDEDLDAV